jgi:hypothetical protein
MVEQITFQTIFQFLQTVSIMVGIAYYFIIMNNQQRNQRLTATYDILEVFRDEKTYYKWLELIRLEWTDVSEFYEKYDSTEWESKWGTMFQYYDGLGLLWKQGLLNVDVFSPIMGAGCLGLWFRYKPVIDEFRVRFNSDYMTYWEQLCEALEPIVKEKWSDDVRAEYYPG